LKITFIFSSFPVDEKLTAKLIKAWGKHYLKAETINWLNHSRGKDELNHRCLKELAAKEQ